MPLYEQSLPGSFELKPTTEDGSTTPAGKKAVAPAVEKNTTPNATEEVIIIQNTSKRVDDVNDRFIMYLRANPRGVREKNFVENYKQKYPSASKMNWPRSTENNVYNYSIQHLSKTNEQLTNLRSKIINVRRKRLRKCQLFC